VAAQAPHTRYFKTIADFRRDNRQAIRNVSREFTLFCRKLDLFSGDLVVIDGSKFKAVNRRDRNFTKKQLKHLIQKLDEDLLDEMERRVLESPEKMKKMKLRKRLAEHPFGTIKHHWDQGHFFTRKLPNVRAEMALTVTAYNIMRAIKILGVQRMPSRLFTRSGEWLGGYFNRGTRIQQQQSLRVLLTGSQLHWLSSRIECELRALVCHFLSPWFSKSLPRRSAHRSLDNLPRRNTTARCSY